MDKEFYLIKIDAWKNFIGKVRNPRVTWDSLPHLRRSQLFPDYKGKRKKISNIFQTKI